MTLFSGTGPKIEAVQHAAAGNRTTRLAPIPICPGIAQAVEERRWLYPTIEAG